MEHDEFVTHWIKQSDSDDFDAAQRLWERYFVRLLQLAGRQLGKTPRRDFDEEDVALSAFRSYFAGMQRGRYPRLDDRHDLWPLLVVITTRKAIDRVNHARRQKRGGGQVRGESAFDRPELDSDEQGIDQVVGREPTPELAALLVEERDRLLGLLGDKSLRRLVEWKLEGHTNDEIATRLRCSLRSVERKLQLIRSKWSQAKGPSETSGR